MNGEPWAAVSSTIYPLAAWLQAIQMPAICSWASTFLEPHCETSKTAVSFSMACLCKSLYKLGSSVYFYRIGREVAAGITHTLNICEKRHHVVDHVLPLVKVIHFLRMTASFSLPKDVQGIKDQGANLTRGNAMQALNLMMYN
jgi:hypothetical protein